MWCVILWPCFLCETLQASYHWECIICDEQKSQSNWFLKDVSYFCCKNNLSQSWIQYFGSIIIESAQTEKLYETNYLLSLLEVNIKGKKDKQGLKCDMQITLIIIRLRPWIYILLIIMRFRWYLQQRKVSMMIYDCLWFCPYIQTTKIH